MQVDGTAEPCQRDAEQVVAADVEWQARCRAAAVTVVEVRMRALRRTRSPTPTSPAPLTPTSPAGEAPAIRPAAVPATAAAPAEEGPRARALARVRRAEAKAAAQAEELLRGRISMEIASEPPPRRPRVAGARPIVGMYLRPEQHNREVATMVFADPRHQPPAPSVRPRPRAPWRPSGWLI